MRLLPLFLLLAAPLICHAEDWTTADGKTIYKDVKVLSHDTAFVTIMYADGGARVPLRSLPASLQKQFGYDSAKAAAAEAATVLQDKQQKQQLEAEAQRNAQAARQRPAQLETSPASTPTAAAFNRPATQPQTTKPTLSPDERQAIKDQIKILQEDVAFMQREEAKLYHSTDSDGQSITASDGTTHIYSHGAYGEKIQDEQQQISDLQAQLR